MAAFLHLLSGETSAFAASAIEANRREAGSRVTVVLLPGAVAPSLEPDVHIRRLATGDLDYSALLDLIFEHDHVVTW
jgi:hypothetical protein